MSWVIYSLLAGIIWAIVNIIDKFVVSNLVRKPMVQVLYYGLICLVVASFVYIFHGFGYLPPKQILIALIGGVIYTGMAITYFYAIMADDISAVISLFKFSPLFIAILAATFLGESFGAIKYLAVALLLGGSFLLNYNRNEGFRLSKAFWLIIVSALFVAISQVISKYLLGFTDYWTVFSYMRLGSFIAIIPLFFIFSGDIKYVIRNSPLKTIGVISLAEVLNLIGILLITVASVTGFVTLVNSLSELQPLFVLLFASLMTIYYPKILKEEVGGSSLVQRLVAIAIMITGAILVA